MVGDERPDLEARMLPTEAIEGSPFGSIFLRLADPDNERFRPSPSMTASVDVLCRAGFSTTSDCGPACHGLMEEPWFCADGFCDVLSAGGLS